MPVLSSELRNQLARVVMAARETAEAGARSALQALAVHHYEPYSPMTPEQRSLRNRLRAHGRQLGDKRDPSRGTQEIGRLVHECAYQHWHRMLFARFLSENDLLIEPNSGVAITMNECEELARDQGENPWVMASRFAQRMLPQIFRADDPVLEVTLPPETQQKLERLLADLPSAVFTADDSLSWTYQFWQSTEKERVKNSGEKITGRTLPAVTQLFTEHYMVLFLLHNTIGAWHAGKILVNRPELIQSATSEKELREAVALNGYSFDYLRFVREPVDKKDVDGIKAPWRPAAGTFDAWPRQAKDLKVLDPCCGSGHFLVAAFDLLVRLRMTEEDLSLEDAIRAVLAENLFGLELDARCTQIAAFNLALSAWKMVGYVIDLPVLNIACSGLSVGVSKSEWLKLAGDDVNLRYGMEQLYDLFEQAPELGSLIDPSRVLPDRENFIVSFSEIQPLLEQALRRDDITASYEQCEIGVTAQGIAKAAELLAGKYTLVITNVPYLGRGDQGHVLTTYIDEYYRDSRENLATVFVERAFAWIAQSGSLAFVTPQNWLSLTRYKRLREQLLASKVWNLIVRLGSKAFQTPMWDFNVMMIILSGQRPAHDTTFCSIDVSAARSMEYKSCALRGKTVDSRIFQLPRDNAPSSGCPDDGIGIEVGQVDVLVQREQLLNPDYRVTPKSPQEATLLEEFAHCFAGVLNGDSPRFQRQFWEIVNRSDLWAYQQTTVKETTDFGGYEKLILFDEVNGHLREDATFRRERLHDSDQRGNQAWGKIGIAVSQMGNLPVSLYTGAKFDSNIAVILPRDQTLVLPIWLFCQSAEFRRSVRALDPKLNVTNATFAKVGFDLKKWQRIANERFPNGLPEPYSNDPTQWIFHGHPMKAEAHTVLQVAVARLLGYRWPAEKDPNMRLASEAREWVNRCRELDQFADTDGIVCLSPVRGESSAADRLRQLLATAFGNDWSTGKERQLLQAATRNGRPVSSLEEWLRDKFFEEHCKLFHNRPFVWHIWDGRKDGFHALVNYHRLAGPNGEGRRTLEALTYSYLGDWIERQKAEQREDKEGADARLVAALDLQEQLKKILEGEPPYDIFVRWKSLHEQPIGWEPDINDGVRLNIRPFMSAMLNRGGRAGAGVLRCKPTINWKKDRGKESESLRPKDDFPWFWGCDPERHPEHRTNFMGGQYFDGNRWNDLHYSIAVKQAARERAAKGAMS
ncbi:Eco57I restriction-modification methylase domain-containing protein [Brevibacillus marinus]|uniref:Eco57I restriction-modification methylase domain-containing protein n=1 Tax=Brevibacillus marinus TaxID=2496837 RepID=UPI000F84214E|nr:DNA methyltransferase [Brevibacillus marinus]